MFIHALEHKRCEAKLTFYLSESLLYSLSSLPLSLLMLLLVLPSLLSAELEPTLNIVFKNSRRKFYLACTVVSTVTSQQEGLNPG